MPDREKVIKGLECCIAYDYKCNDCPYQDDGGAEDGCYSDELKTDALALLKGQERIDAIPVEWLWKISERILSTTGQKLVDALIERWHEEQEART